MILWLCLVAGSVVLAFQKWQKTRNFLKKQMFYLWVGGAIVFIGDSLHTIAATIAGYTGNPTGPIAVLGSIFEFRTFAMFFDALVFMIYYALWALFIVVRYQQGQFESYDKVSVGLAMAAMVCILPGVVPNALGIYTLQYNIAIWAPHIILFIIFGMMTVMKLITSSRYALKQTTDPIIQIQERSLSITGIGFAFSFLFFTLHMAFSTLNAKTGMFMILKTFAYMLSFVYLVKGVILPTPKA
jgi:hypothetical protein